MTAPSDPPEARPPPARAGRNFSLYLGGNSAAWAGLGLADVLFLWLVFSETGSTLAVAAVGLAQSIPPIALGYLAGALADRASRSKVIFLAVAAEAAIVALVPITLGAIGFRLTAILALALGLETASVVCSPSATALLPNLVSPEGVEASNAIAQALTSVAWAFGAAAAAGLLLVTNATASFAATFVVLAVGAILLAMIAVSTRGPVPAVPRSERGGLGAELAEGVRFLRSHAWLPRLTFASVAVGFFVAMFSPYLVVYTVDALASPASSFGYLAGGYSAGFFVGSLLSARLRVTRFFGRFFGATVLASAGLLGVLALSREFAVALVVLAALGILMGLLLTGSITLMQRVVPTTLLGRYLGLEETLAWGVAPVGVAAGGLVIAAYGVQAGFAASALGLAIVGGIALGSAKFRAIRYEPGAVRDPETPPGGPLTPTASAPGLR